jgi:diguanylate cyclase (GGDEF)-like protein/PAS domain S-box-containing protein
VAKHNPHSDSIADVSARLLDAVPDAIIVFDAELKIRYSNRAAQEFMGQGEDAQSDEPLDATSMVHPDDLEGLFVELMEVFASPGTARTSRARVRNGEEIRPIEVCFVNMLDDPDLRGVVASFRDLRTEAALLAESEAKQRLIERNEALRHQLQEREAFQARMLQIQQSISRRMPVNDVLVAVVQGTHDLLSDEIVELRLDPLDGQGQPTVVESFEGRVHVLDAGEIDEATDSLGRSARSTDGMVVADGDVAAVVGHHVAQCGLAIPIRDRHRIIGSLAIATQRQGRVYRDVEREMLTNLAAHASVAIMDARTVDSVQAAFTDPLTGLPNRALLMDRLAQSADRCAREGTPLAVMFIDLARFKGINDSYGHAVGDVVLAAVGRRVSSQLRGADTGARLGGDEFVVVLENADADTAQRVATRLLAALREPIHAANRVLYADATIGIAMSLDGGAVLDCELLLRHADIAMYQGKTTTRDIVFFETAMQAELLQRQELESELRGAITAKSLHVELQPLIELATGQICAVEALARWHHPVRGLVAPVDFVTTAERIGAVVELDRLVWAEACHHVGQLPLRPDGTPVSLSLNLSAKHLLSADLIEVLSQMVERSGLVPDRLTIELTETELMRDVVAAAEQMWALRRFGAHIAIDDFGTGYSSLAYLQKLPVEELKIDRTFISGVDQSLAGYRLVNTMVNLAHGLGLRVVAEGIEQPGEAEALRTMGADVGQGFLFSRPLDPIALNRLVRSGPMASTVSHASSHPPLRTSRTQ